jgi:hypothetical protein
MLAPAPPSNVDAKGYSSQLVNPALVSAAVGLNLPQAAVLFAFCVASLTLVKSFGFPSLCADLICATIYGTLAWEKITTGTDCC